jgi:uncharacterized protein YuzE
MVLSYFECASLAYIETGSILGYTIYKFGKHLKIFEKITTLVKNTQMDKLWDR